MANINMPQRPKSNAGNMMSLLGAGAGALAGGPAGAAAGMQIGGALGSMQQQPQGPAAVETAMTRKLGKLDNSPLMQIRESMDALKYVEDPAQRIELAKPLVMAEMQARKQYG